MLLGLLWISCWVVTQVVQRAVAAARLVSNWPAAYRYADLRSACCREAAFGFMFRVVRSIDLVGGLALCVGALRRGRLKSAYPGAAVCDRGALRAQPTMARMVGMLNLSRAVLKLPGCSDRR